MNMLEDHHLDELLTNKGAESGIVYLSSCALAGTLVFRTENPINAPSFPFRV